MNNSGVFIAIFLNLIILPVKVIVHVLMITRIKNK